MNASTFSFQYDCEDEPRSDMLRRGDGTGRAVPNAACAMKTYNGGLQCCKHKFFLTDAAQVGWWLQEHLTSHPPLFSTPNTPTPQPPIHRSHANTTPLSCRGGRWCGSCMLLASLKAPKGEAE